MTPMKELAVTIVRTGDAALGSVVACHWSLTHEQTVRLARTAKPINDASPGLRGNGSALGRSAGLM
jgi:hypothetical protein